MRRMGKVPIAGYVFNTPSVRATGERASMRDVHNIVAHRKKYIVAHRKKYPRGLRFGEEICQIICTVHERYCYIVSFDAFAHKEMTAVDVLGPLMVLRVVGEVDRGLVIQG
eukprot:5561672-Pleurochrysis_carterae.AAC.1